MNESAHKRRALLGGRVLSVLKTANPNIASEADALVSVEEKIAESKDFASSSANEIAESTTAHAQKAPALTGASVDQWQNREYFGSYSHIAIHEDMIRDAARTGAYRRAILENAADFKGKVVADVGCGTGILSLFCIEAGASKVYAIDASDMADFAKAVAIENNVQDKLEVIKGKVEEVELPEKVDVIVSEWMGYFLLYESMLESVLYARDKWLKEEGVMYPAVANLYMAPLSDEEYYGQRVNFWNDVYGWKFASLKDYAVECAFKEPLVEVVPGQCVIGRETKIHTIDCKTVKKEDVQTFTSTFSSSLYYNGPIHGLVGWFDVEFVSPQPGSKKVILTTSPSAVPTHWCQVSFWLPKDVPECKQDDTVNFAVSVSRHETFKRGLKIDLQFSIDGQDSTHQKTFHLV